MCSVMKPRTTRSASMFTLGPEIPAVTEHFQRLKNLSNTVYFIRRLHRLAWVVKESREVLHVHSYFLNEAVYQTKFQRLENISYFAEA